MARSRLTDADGSADLGRGAPSPTLINPTPENPGPTPSTVGLLAGSRRRRTRDGQVPPDGRRRLRRPRTRSAPANADQSNTRKSGANPIHSRAPGRVAQATHS